MKLKTIYVCSNCGFETAKWQGKCPNCEAWNSFVEETINVGKPDTQPGHVSVKPENIKKPQSLQELQTELTTMKEKRLYPFSTHILNSFWGGQFSENSGESSTNGGLTAGSLTLLAGEPGLGKSTFALQILRSLYNGAKGTKPNLLYITAEESAHELARRSIRLQIPDQITIYQSNNYEQIHGILESEKPEVVIIDSIQTIFSSVIPSSPGSVAQVSTIASNFLALSKSKNIAIVIIGHVTKEGQIAGPKTLEHLVDSVLLLESNESAQYRTLAFSKHRFGTTSQMLLLKMEEKGLEIVTDPSLALLENIETGVGVCYGMSIDKELPLIIEIQALVQGKNSSTESTSFFGRREAIGVKQAKLNTIIAIAEKYLSVNLKSQDVYLQVTGLPKNSSDESLDLPILLAILSSYTNRTVESIIAFSEKKQTCVFAGRITLSGNLRSATQEEQRSKTAEKLSFHYNPRITKGSISSLLKQA